MGRKTYESIGKPLPGRINIVLTRGEEPVTVDPNVWIYTSVPKLLNDLKGKRTFIIGGRELFDTFMKFADELWVTHISNTYIADTFAPRIDMTKWRVKQSKILTDGVTAKLYIKN